MDKAAAEKISAQLPDSATVVDVGGGASPFARADYVIDAIAFDDRAKLGMHDVGISPRFSQDRWIQVDLCDHRPWPIEDKKFDFATCSHLLEDVRDPIWICAEMGRIAKAGYIEVPSRVVEQSLGVEHPSYAGFYHHRWLITNRDGHLECRHKPHMLHSIRKAIVASVGIRRAINPKHAITTLWWQDSIPCTEILEFSEDRVAQELCDFASEARQIPDVTVSNGLTIKDAVKRSIYFTRLKFGQR